MVMKKASKRGLGQTACDPLLGSIELLEDEYYALIKQRQQSMSILLKGQEF